MLLLYISLMVAMGLGAIRFDFGWGKENPLEPGDPIRMSMEALKEEFGGNDMLAILYKPKDGDLFSSRTLRVVHSLHTELEGLINKRDKVSPITAYLDEVNSIIHANYTEVEGDSISFEAFIGDNLPKNSEQSDLLRQKALGHPDYKRTFFSSDLSIGGMWLRTKFRSFRKSEQEIAAGGPSDSPYKTHSFGEYLSFERAVGELVTQPRYAEHLEFLPSTWGAVFRKDVFEPQMNLAMLTSLLMGALVLLLLFHSLSAMAWTFVVMTSSSLTIVGLAGWLGMVIDLELYIVVGLVNVAALADSIHVLSGFVYFRRKGHPFEESMRAVFEKTGLACLLTSVTTAIGLASLYFIPITTIKNMGVLGAAGVIVAFLYTVFLLPILMHIRAPQEAKVKAASLSQSVVGQGASRIQRLLSALDGWTCAHPKGVVLVFVGLGAFFVAGASKVVVNTNMAEQYKEATSVRQVIETVNTSFGGTGNLELVVDTQEQDGLTDPRILNLMANMERFLQQEYPALGVKAYSLVNIVKDTYRKFNEDKPEFYRIPSSPTLLSQLYLMISSGNPDELGRVVNDELSLARMSIRLKDPGSGVSVEIVERVQKEIDKQVKELRADFPELRVTLTGNAAFFSKLHDYISWSQIRSFGLAFLIISLILVVIFGSLKVGLLAVVPNAFPALTIFGVMGWMDVPLGLTTLLVAPVVIGIAVDDTIHFLTHYTLELKEHGSIRHALGKSTKEVGQAIFFTSVVLGISFLAFVPISHLGISRFGFLAVLAIVAAFVADLVLLPALCLLFRAR